MTPQKAVQKLRSRGMTLALIATSAKSKISTIFDVASGDDPRWSLGNRLIELAQAPKEKKK